MSNNSALYNVYQRRGLSFVKGEGVWLETQDGDKYLDCFAGVGVNAFGHANPVLIEALIEQAHKVWHISNIFVNPLQEELAQKLCDISFADKVFFANSGAEAVECAIKTARKYHAQLGNVNRYEIITFVNSFHGRTLATISAGGNPKYTDGFEPILKGFKHVDLGNKEDVLASISEKTAAILIEPIQGEGGVFPVEEEFLRFLRETCDKYGLLLIYDEIQCGFGRTGKMFAYEWSNVAPDIMTIAKAMGSGFPVGACLATNIVANSMVAGSHGSTFGGNALAMAVALKTLDLMQQNGFLESVQQRASELMTGLKDLQNKYPHLISDIRGKGLMLGLKPVFSNLELVQKLQDKFILAITAGDNIVRLLPPLIITQEQIQLILSSLDEIFQSY
ncbi:aspartate aminotransferase family protein [Bartonella sp. DGB1]|uniref:aspartate aminotransferase family protein n=1 Tax=Bartonella sp. DGB1 TaxID=3239807 RepID=UPI003523CF69